MRVVNSLHIKIAPSDKLKMKDKVNLKVGNSFLNYIQIEVLGGVLHSFVELLC